MVRWLSIETSAAGHLVRAHRAWSVRHCARTPIHQSGQQCRYAL